MYILFVVQFASKVIAKVKMVFICCAHCVYSDMVIKIVSTN